MCSGSFGAFRSITAGPRHGGCRHEVDVRVARGLAAGKRAERGEPGVAALGRQRRQDRPGRLQQHLGVARVELPRRLQMLAHHRLGDAKRVRDLVLTRAHRSHRAQRQQTPQPRDPLIPTSTEMGVQQAHKKVQSDRCAGFGRITLSTVDAESVATTCELTQDAHDLDGWAKSFERAVGSRDFDCGTGLFSDDVVAYGTRATAMFGLASLLTEQWTPIWTETQAFHFTDVDYQESWAGPRLDGHRTPSAASVGPGDARLRSRVRHSVASILNSP